MSEEPTKELSVEYIFAKLNQRFNPSQAKDMRAVYQFQLRDAQPFHLNIQDGSLLASWGEHPDPDITLHLSESVLASVVSGQLDGMSAYMKGQLRAEGNLLLATQLGKLFRH